MLPGALSRAELRAWRLPKPVAHCPHGGDLVLQGLPIVALGDGRPDRLSMSTSGER